MDTQAKQSHRQQYAISEYHNTSEVYAKLDNLVSQPMRPVRREKLQEFLSYFENHCKSSKALTDEAKKYIPKIYSYIERFDGSMLYFGRTEYGLFRILHRLGARVKIKI